MRATDSGVDGWCVLAQTLGPGTHITLSPSQLAVFHAGLSPLVHNTHTRLSKPVTPTKDPGPFAIDPFPACLHHQCVSRDRLASCLLLAASYLRNLSCGLQFALALLVPTLSSGSASLV